MNKGLRNTRNLMSSCTTGQAGRSRVNNGLVVGAAGLCAQVQGDRDEETLYVFVIKFLSVKYG